MPKQARGASRIEPIEQVVHATGNGYDISFRPRLKSEDENAAMSLATNLAIADALFAAGTGLFRVMPEPDERAQQRLRHTARALGIEWSADRNLARLRALARWHGAERCCAADGHPARRRGSVVRAVRGGETAVAFGDGRDIRARHRASASPCRPLRRDGRACCREWQTGAGRDRCGVRRAARR